MRPGASPHAPVPTTTPPTFRRCSPPRACRRFLFDGAALTAVEVAAMLADRASLAPGGPGGWTLRPRGGPAGSPPLGCAALLPVGAAARSAPRLAGEVEPSVALAEPSWGAGLAREALSALAAHALGTPRLPGLVAVADAPNARSTPVLLAAGFAADGGAPGPAHAPRLFRSGAARGPAGRAGSRRGQACCVLAQS